jgi:hypothetical protein
MEQITNDSRSVVVLVVDMALGPDFISITEPTRICGLYQAATNTMYTGSSIPRKS